MGLGTPVVPYSPFHVGVSLLKLNSRKKGTLIIKGLLLNLGGEVQDLRKSCEVTWGEGNCLGLLRGKLLGLRRIGQHVRVIVNLSSILG